MTDEPGSLLESDGLDEILEGSWPPPGLEVPEGSAPPPPVVVVRYGNRARSWLLFVALTAVLTLGGLLAHNWGESRRLQVQALQSRRALERATEKARADELEIQWMAAARPSVAMTPSPPTPTKVRPDPGPAGTATATPATSGALAAGKSLGSPPSPAAVRPGSSPSLRPKVLDRLPEKAEPTPAPSSRPDVAVAPSVPRTEARTPVETAAIVPDRRSPFEDPEGAGGAHPAPARADTAGPASASKPGAPPVGAAASVAPAAESPSPSLELAYYDQAIRLDAGNAGAYIDRGNAWWTRKEYDLALADYDEAIRLNPWHAGAYGNRGAAWKAKREYDRALADYNQAIRLDPRSANAYSNRGVAWADKGQYDRALADYDQAIRLDPGHAEAYNNRAWLWATCPDARHRDGRRAIASATQACELSGWEAHHIGTLAAACAEAGDFDAAMRWQSQANERYEDAEDEKKGEERLRLYREKRPYRETNH
jgi:Flp pilus assembly protein TadD